MIKCYNDFYDLHLHTRLLLPRENSRLFNNICVSEFLQEINSFKFIMIINTTFLFEIQSDFWVYLFHNNFSYCLEYQFKLSVNFFFHQIQFLSQILFSSSISLILTNALIIPILTTIAFLLLNTLDSIETPCSVNA